MAATSSRSIADVEGLTPDGCASALAPLFEGAPRFLARLCAARPFADADRLFATARRIAHSMPVLEQVELIDAHPRLGAPPASVSALSFDEQGYEREATAVAATEVAPTDVAAAVAGADAEAERRRVANELERLNLAYEARFGFRYCVFVAGRSRADLLPDFEAALSADPDGERVRAIEAVIDIAADRWQKLAHG